MRIVGGRLKGRPLAGPKGDGGAARLRPTSDRMRESIFNILAHGDYPDIEGARVLDLFAGSGALGLEALSRGAARALFVDDGTEARAIIRRNIEALGVIGQTKLYRRDATRLGPNRAEPYSLIFMDAPYRKGLSEKALASAMEGGWITEGAVILCETAADETFTLPDELTILHNRQFGEGRLIILSK